MKRYWVSWWSGYYIDEGCTKPPFQMWETSSRERRDGRDEVSLCAVIDAERGRDIWKVVKYHFPDFEARFCEERPSDYAPPSDRFPNFRNRTTLIEQTEH